MIPERVYSLILDEVSSLTIQHEDNVGVFHSRITPGHEAVIGMRISIGMHAAAMLFILLLPYFSIFQVGGKPDCVTVSLVSPPGEDNGRESTQIERREATDEIRRLPEKEVPKKPSLVRPKTPEMKEKKHTLVSAKPKPKTNPGTPAPSNLNQLTPQDNNNTAEQETGKDRGSEMIFGDGMNPAASEGRPVHEGPGEFSLQQVDQPPTPKQRIEPEFPLTARRLGIGGKVVVKFLVKADGSVAKASIVEAEPEMIFEQSALEAVREWQFNPGRFHGVAVATWVVLPIQFRLTR